MRLQGASPVTASSPSVCLVLWEESEGEGRAEGHKQRHQELLSCSLASPSKQCVGPSCAWHLDNIPWGLGRSCSSSERDTEAQGRCWQLCKTLLWTQPHNLQTRGTPGLHPCTCPASTRHETPTPCPLEDFAPLTPSSQHVNQLQPLLGPLSYSIDPRNHPQPLPPSVALELPPTQFWPPLPTHLPSPRPPVTITASIALTFDL